MLTAVRSAVQRHALLRGIEIALRVSSLGLIRISGFATGHLMSLTIGNAGAVWLWHIAVIESASNEPNITLLFSSNELQFDVTVFPIICDLVLLS